jgi:hypothetical protein
MKKIICGKVYDTEKAKKVASWYSSYARNDFNYYEEELYKKKTGEFFLYGEGNAASPYSRSCGQNEWCGGEKIVPLTFKEAQEWAEKHLNGDDYCDIFGEPDEDAEDVTLGIAVSAEVAAKLRRAAAENGISQRAQLERWIMEGK